MNKAVKETLKAVGWMSAGAVLLVVAWFAYAQLVLLPQFRSRVGPLEEQAIITSGEYAQTPAQPAANSFRYRRSTMSYLYVPDAAPALPDDHAKWRGGWLPDDPRPAVEHAVTGHRVATGSGAMLNYQRYSDDVDPPAATDYAVFEKITVFLPENLTGDYGHLSLSENPEIVVFWSRGSPQLDRGVMCSGYARSGEIEYRRVAGELEAKLFFEISPKGTVQPDGRACEPFTFRHASEFWAGSVDRLDQWTGGGWGKVSPLECMPGR